MERKLFITCPFAKLEDTFKAKYNHDYFMLTSFAAVFSWDDLVLQNSMKNLIKREAINEVVIVVDQYCRVIDRIILRKPLYGLPAERFIKELYIEYYFSDFIGRPLVQQQYRLAELVVQSQLNELASLSFMNQLISSSAIAINGMVSNKDELPFVPAQHHIAPIRTGK